MLNLKQSKLYIKLVAVLLLLSPTITRADLILTDNYYSLQYASFVVDSGSSSGLFKYSLGHKFTDTWATEVQIGIAPSPENADQVLVYGAYLRANIEFDEVSIYGLLGYAGSYAYDDTFGNSSEESVSFGAGVELYADKSFSLTAEYLQLLYTDDNKAYSFGLGYTYYFYDDDSRFNKNNQRIKSIRKHYR